ncbi:MAG TPA: hypothetical protein VGP05_13830 [Pseudonocardia sp.]|jgi:hypothetical protein|nr:hypothetical protein [Pseudonocardia sp.]
MAIRSRLSAADLLTSLLAVHQPDTPFVVRDGRADGVDLIAELRFQDETWNKLFRGVGLSRAYTIRMRIDESNAEVRKKEKLGDIGWRNGEHYAKRFGARSTEFGEISETIYAATYARKGLFKLEKETEFRYRTADLRDPLVRAIYRAGWECRNVTFRKL